MTDGHSGYSSQPAHGPLPGYPAVADAGSFPPAGHGRRQALTAVGAAALSFATWAAWLGWDHSASYDSVSGQVEDPYVTLQVAGCVLTLAVLTAALSALGRRPVPVAGGVSFGFWLPWTVVAVLGDDSGLSLVGSFMVAIGLVVGTAIAALVGIALRCGIEAISRRRVRHRRGAHQS